MDYSIDDGLFEGIKSWIKYYILPSEENDYRSRFLQNNILFYCVVILFALRIFTTFSLINFPQNVFFADITKSTLENFVNQTRQSLGLPELKENQKLNQAAQLKAQNMINNNYFAHTSPEGLTPWFWFLQAGYNYKFAGENLAVGFYESEEVYNAWLNSASHKANIINPNYTEMGTAVMRGFGQNNAILVVQEFGSPLVKNITPVKSESIKKEPDKKPSSIQSEKIMETSKDLQATENQSATENTKENLLPENPGLQTISQPAVAGSSDAYYKIMNIMVYSYDDIVQNIIYGISLIVIGILLSLIFFNFEVKFKKDLVFRSILIVLLLSAATLMDKDIIVSIIPHQIII